MMTWAQFQKRRLLYHKAWQALKDELEGEIKEYINRSKLVIDYEQWQHPYNFNDVLSIAVDYPNFLVKDKAGAEIIDIAKRYKNAKEKDKEEKKKAVREAHEFDVERLYVIDNTGEIRFPELRIDFIQKIKHSCHVDHEMTDMSKASIRVVLKID